MAEELFQFEAVDGVRMPWNIWPRSKVEALKCVLPFAIMYTPVKRNDNMKVCCKQACASSGHSAHSHTRMCPP